MKSKKSSSTKRYWLAISLNQGGVMLHPGIYEVV
jgi:hypothetical protein